MKEGRNTFKEKAKDLCILLYEKVTLGKKYTDFHRFNKEKIQFGEYGCPAKMVFLKAVLKYQIS